MRFWLCLHNPVSYTSYIKHHNSGILKLGGVKASQGGREHDSDILMKSSSELQSNLVTTSLLIHYIRICDLVLSRLFCLDFNSLLF